MLLLAALVVYLAGNGSVPLWDRDEPRYAQTSRQMLQSGDWIVPHFLDEVRSKKPVFIYWCQASSMKLFHDTDYAARLPSVAAMMLTIVMLYVTMRHVVGRRRAVWTVFIFATGGLVIASAKMCLTDSVLLLWITMTQLSLYALLQRRGGWIAWAGLGIGSGFAILTKGPVVLGVCGMTVVMLGILRLIDGHSSAPRTLSARRIWNSRAAIGAIMAIALILLICLPWFIAVERRIPGYFLNTLQREVIDRARAAQEGHKGPPGYYLLMVWGTFFPWSLLLPGALVYGWKHRANSATRFALAGVAGPWLMFELVRTKLPYYILPIFPGLALLTARMLIWAARRGRMDLRNRTFLRCAGVWASAVGLIALAPLAISLLSGRATPTATVAAGLTTAIGLEYARRVLVAFRAGRPAHAAAFMGAGMFILIAMIYGVWLGNLPAIDVSRRVANLLPADGAVRAGDVIMIDYKEPSLAFYQGGTIREESNNSYLTQTDPHYWPRWIVLTQPIWESLPDDIRNKLDRIGSVEGWWMNKAKRAQVLVVRKR